MGRLSHGWVREVHRHSSKRKKGKIFVLFRNTENRVLSGLAELTRHLEEHGLEDSWVEEAEKGRVGSKDDIRRKGHKEQACVSFTECSLYGLGSRQKEGESRKISLDDGGGTKVTFQEDRKKPERKSRSLGTFPTTPGVPQEERVFPQPTNINIIINC